MKWLLTSFLFTCAGFVSAQVDLQVGYNFSSRIENNHKNLSHSFSLAASHKRIILTVGYGQEFWHYTNNPANNNDAKPYTRSKANKLEVFCGYELPVLKNQLTISFLYGFRNYFRNEIEKNLAFYSNGISLPIEDGFVLSHSSRTEILDYYPSYEINSTFAYISKMRYAHLLKINVSYTYKNVGLHVFYLPNLIHFTYETPLEPKEYGSNYLLFHDVGIGLSYTLSCKPKKQA